MLTITEPQATASGDQTVKIWDAETRTCTGVLAGHTCTIKNVTWDPFNPRKTSRPDLLRHASRSHAASFAQTCSPPRLVTVRSESGTGECRVKTSHRPQAGHPSRPST